MQTYGLVCKKATDNANSKRVTSKTGRLQCVANKRADLFH